MSTGTLMAARSALNTLSRLPPITETASARTSPPTSPACARAAPLAAAMAPWLVPTRNAGVSTGDFSHTALKATRECVIAIPAVEIAGKVVEVGNCSGRDTDKFTAIGLTAKPAALVAAPLIGECFANLECRVVDTRLVNRFNLFVLEVVKAWHRPSPTPPRTLHHHGYGTFAVDGQIITLPSRMP